MMRQVIHLAFHYFRKDKKQYLSFGIILLITALILHLSLVLTLRVDPAYDEKAAALHTSDVDVLIPAAMDSDRLEEGLSRLDGVTELEKQHGVMLPAVIKDFRGTDFRLNLIFYRYDASRRLNMLEVMEESGGSVRNGVYLPLYIAEFGEFPVGSEITFDCDGTLYTYTVAGVVQEMQYGNASAETMGIYLPSMPYQSLLACHPAAEAVGYSLVTEDGADNRTVLSKAAGTVEDNGGTVLYSVTNESRKQSRTMVSGLLTVILAAFAAVVLLVSVFLCRFRIRNIVDEEMAQMGVLKAMGFTSRTIIAATVLPYVLTALAGSVIGAGMSYRVLPGLVDMLALQAGFRFAVGFRWDALLLTVGLLTAVTFVFTFLAAGRIRKLLPIMAIRGIAEGGKIRKNAFPMDRTPGGIEFLLMLKQMASSAKQNALLFVVLFVMTVLVAFSGNLFYNVIVKPDHFTLTLSEETPDVIFTVSAGDMAAFRKDLNSREEVTKVLAYAVQRGVKVNDENVTAFVCEDFSQTRNDLCYEGRNPENPMEAAVGSAVAQASGIKIGDTVEVSDGDATASFRVVGLVQSVNCQGEICELTDGGFSRLSEDTGSRSLYVYLKDSDGGENLIRQAETAYPDEIVSSVNHARTRSEAQGLYAVVVNAVILVIFLVTGLIVLLILFVIIKSIIVQRRQEFGIYKAIGYSGRQLVMQLAGSLMPVSIAAVMSSALLGLIYVPTMNRAIFGMIGAMKNHMEVPAGVLLVFAAAEIAGTFFISLLLAGPVRKTEAYSLIKE